VVGVPPLGVGEGQPTQEPRQVAVASRPDDEVPVVGHEAVRQEADRVALAGLGEDPLEGFVVAVVLEERQAAVGPVEGVVDVVGVAGTEGAAHAGRL
jgi:hypothetical protein